MCVFLAGGNYVNNVVGGRFVLRTYCLILKLKIMEIETKTTMPNVNLRNGVTGMGWTITDSQRDGEDNLEKSCGRIEEINKLLVKKFGSPGKRIKKNEDEGDGEED